MIGQYRRYASAAHSISKKRLVRTPCYQGGSVWLEKDVPPYTMAGKRPLSLQELTDWVLRRGFTMERIERIKRYTELYIREANVSAACRKVEETFPESR